MSSIRVVSFDLWDTVFVDDSDEPKRKQQGLAPKAVERRNLLHTFVSRHKPIERELVDCAYDTADAAFREVWYGQHVTWPVATRLRVVLKGLKREIPDPEFRELVRLHEDMELGVRPDLVPGIAESIHELASHYKLVVISDAIFSPGRALRELLAGYGLLDAFSGFVFSDEIGWSKPRPEVFQRAAELCACTPQEIVHVGDREHTDINGAKDIGARAVLITAAKDRGSRNTRADAICSDGRCLAGIIQNLCHPTSAS
jgi:putative hydrolase of the HAD superfamily